MSGLRNTIIISSIACLPPLWAAQAQSAIALEISPYVIDESARARDTLEFDVKLKNTGTSKLDIYPVVNDITSENGKMEFIDPALLDKSTSLARWISFKRGVIELRGGEEETVKLKIDVNVSARPGKYHAIIAFPHGSNRPLAETNLAERNYPQLAVNIEVTEEVIEKAQITKFSVQRNIYFTAPVNLEIDIKNIGNRTVVPRGSLFIQNRRGIEVANLPLNPGEQSIEPAATGNFFISWPEPVGFGKYKIRLEATYGEAGQRDLQDAAFFWYLPKRLMALFATGLAILAVLLAFFLFWRAQKVFAVPHQTAQAGRDGIINLKDKSQL